MFARNGKLEPPLVFPAGKAEFQLLPRGEPFLLRLRQCRQDNIYCPGRENIRNLFAHKAFTGYSRKLGTPGRMPRVHTTVCIKLEQ